jgi:transposase
MSTGGPAYRVRPSKEDDMIVVGIDPHKKTHTAVAVDAATGAPRGEITVGSGKTGHGALLAWARAIDAENLFAIEDCRHVSGSLERFLLGRGERVVRVPPKLSARIRRTSRTRGKSDPIDARAVAEAALREPGLPEARLSGPERDVRLLVDHRDDLVGERTRMQARLRWHLHDLELGADVPPKALDRLKWLDRLASALSALPATTQTSVAADLVARCRSLTAEINRLEHGLTGLMERIAPQLLAQPGCGAIIAARLVGETGGASRFKGEAAFAMHIGTAPLPVSSGQTSRHRLNRSGNRRLNSAVHIIAITQARTHEPARAFMARKQAEGKSKREALRCLKRHIARAVFGILREVDAANSGEVVQVAFRSQTAPVAASA